MDFSQEELTDMVYALGEGERNYLLASRIYAQRFPERRHPHPRCFEKLRERFERTGHVQYEKRERTSNEENEFMVVASVVEDPHTSTRTISRELDVSQATVSRILRKNKFHPYHIQLVQELDQRDFQNRLNFCEWAIERYTEQNDFFDFILFMDEATFHKNEYVNRHNFHYYDTTNPRFVRPLDHQHRWSLNVWGGILGNRLIGPYFFDNNVNGQNYCDFLQNYLQNCIDDLPLNTIRRLWLQQDGAPAHYSLQVRNHLNNEFPNRWIGRGGPRNWPARSPDLTKLDFFLWGYVKEHVYKTTPTTREDMKTRIRNCFATVNETMLRRVNNSFIERLQLCIRQNGGYIEQIL